MTGLPGAAEILAELYPPPYEIVTARPTPVDGFLALPSPGAARILLPASAKLAAASLTYARRPHSLRGRLQTSAAVAALRSGIGRAAAGFAVHGDAGADSIEHLLGTVLGQPVVIGIFLGPPRANRKPVLQVMGEDGTLLAIAKVGINPLTRSLAANEAAALTVLNTSPMPILQTPELLHFGDWRGHVLLVQSALDLVGVPLDNAKQVRDSAMRALAEGSGVRSGAWEGSDYHRRLADRIESLGDSALVDDLRRSVDLLAGTDSIVRFGTWHGDWTAWNMAVRGDRALVWDWERYETDVPVGFDPLHFAFMPALKSSSGSERAALELLAAAPTVLRSWGISHVDATRIAFSYILELATRYLSDRQADTGVSGGTVTRWLEPMLATVRIGGISELGGWRG